MKKKFHLTGNDATEGVYRKNKGGSIMLYHKDVDGDREYVHIFDEDKLKICFEALAVYIFMI